MRDSKKRGEKDIIDDFIKIFNRKSRKSFKCAPSESPDFICYDEKTNEEINFELEGIVPPRIRIINKRYAREGTDKKMGFLVYDDPKYIKFFRDKIIELIKKKDDHIYNKFLLLYFKKEDDEVYITNEILEKILKLISLDQYKNINNVFILKFREGVLNKTQYYDLMKQEFVE